jgi:thiol-disulfide isomerase/thioredoxin
MCSNRGIGRLRALCLIAGGLAMAATGCSAPSPTPPAPKPSTRAAPPAKRPVEVTLVDHAGLMRAVEARRGRIVVLDCWSTSCPPCVKEFPGLVTLAAKYRDQIACLSLAFDYEGIGTPEEVLPPVQAFLEQIGAADITNMLNREEADSLYKKLDLVSIPAIYIYKPDGTLARRFDDEDASQRLGRPFTYADVEAEIRSLLPATTER